MVRGIIEPCGPAIKHPADMHETPEPATNAAPQPAALHMARKYVWWKSPQEALEDKAHFLGMMMTYGTLEDVKWMLANFSEDELREAIEQAQPGVFNGRSWSYWHLRLGIKERHEMPKRRLPS